MNGNKYYTSTVHCEKDGEVFAMTKQDFLKLHSNQLVWKNFQDSAIPNLEKLSNTIIVNTLAETKVIGMIDLQIDMIKKSKNGEIGESKMLK